jgi:hypothetical protein
MPGDLNIIAAGSRSYNSSEIMREDLNIIAAGSPSYNSSGVNLNATGMKSSPLSGEQRYGS